MTISDITDILRGACDSPLPAIPTMSCHGRAARHAKNDLEGLRADITLPVSPGQCFIASGGCRSKTRRPSTLTLGASTCCCMAVHAAIGFASSAPPAAQ
jgi:hypothetical protein